MTLLGCSDSPSDPGDIAVSLAPTASTFKAGERIGITVTIINIGSRDHTLTDTGCPRPFQVFDDNGPVDLGGELCNSIAVRIPLRPGDSYSFHLDWTGEKSSFANGTVVRAPLAPGFYTLRGNVRTEEFGTVSAGMARVYILPSES